MKMDKFYLQAVAKKLKKQGKSEEEVDKYIKNLIYPKNMDEEQKEKDEEVLSEAEASASVDESGETNGTEEEPTLPGEDEPI